MTAPEYVPFDQYTFSAVNHRITDTAQGHEVGQFGHPPVRQMHCQRIQTPVLDFVSPLARSQRGGEGEMIAGV